MTVTSERERVRITDTRGNEAFGEIEIVRWDRRARTKRTLRYLGICWGLAVCTVFLPLVHFVLVPGFLLAGPFLAAYAYGQEGAILGGSGTCPGCKAALPIASGGIRPAFRDLCSSCHNEVSIERQA